MQIDMRRIDPSLNMNRFYFMELTKDLFGEHGVHRQWGRFGTWGRHRHDWYATKTEAESALSDLVKQKLARGYLIKLSVTEGQGV
ncbi:MAG: WGR domain-containing protein [Gammaproteobacteria bacterium]|nr:WGR domain-containing protein [Gammaproteobacteria bacterium]